MFGKVIKQQTLKYEKYMITYDYNLNNYKNYQTHSYKLPIKSSCLYSRLYTWKIEKKIILLQLLKAIAQ